MVEFQNVRMGYDTSEGYLSILNDVSFQVHEGETVAITGPSGSGKTTLLLLLSGLEKAVSGEVILTGNRVSAMSADSLADWRRDNMGIVFQSFHLLPGLTALANVSLPLDIAGSRNARQEAMQLLESVGMSHRLDHYPSQLSGGEQQRVAIARALVHQPRLILGDEPTGNLDRKTGDRILSLLFDQQGESGSTLILVTHDDRVAERCQRVLRLEEGVLREV